MRFILTIAVLLLASSIYGQELIGSDTAIVNGDTTVLRSLEANGDIQEIEMQAPDHSPARATLLSATIPGLGQAYNKKYWKIPIVWGGLGAFGYFISWNNERYQFYRQNLIYELEGDPDYPNETSLTREQLLSSRDFYRRNRDQLALYGILFYMLQIVDAHVDAHLIEFDVNQDLSVKLEPSYLQINNQDFNYGLSLKFTF